MRGSAWLLVVAVLGLLLGCKAADPAPGAGASAELLPVDPAVTRGRLSNGFSYVLKPLQNDGRAVQLTLLLRVGSAVEQEDERGLAHFVEHVVLDQAYAGLSVDDFSRRLGMARGHDTNGSTSLRATSYKVGIHEADPQTLAQGLDLLKGIAGAARFDDDTVSRSRAIVLAELSSREEPLDALKRWLMYRESPLLERWPRGLESVVRGASALQLQAFYQRWYRPEQLGIVIVGQFEQEGLLRMIEERFAGLASGERQPVPNMEVPLAPGEQLLLRPARELGLEQSRVELLSLLPATALQTASDLRLWLLDQCLAGLLDARLERLWLQPPAPFDDLPQAIVASTSGGDPGVLWIRARAKPGQLRAAVESLAVELERLRRFGPTTRELLRAREGLARLAQRAGAGLSVQSESDRLAGFFLRGQAATSVEQQVNAALRLLPQIDVAALQARAAEWLGAGRRSLVALHAPGDVSLGSEQELASLLRDVRSRALEPQRDDVPRPLLARLPAPGRIEQVERLSEIGVVVWTLQNGATVAFKQGRPGMDRVLLRALSPGGVLRAAPLRPESAATALQVLADSGVAEHGIQELFQLLEGTRVSVVPWIDADFTGLRAESGAAELELMLQLVFASVTSPRVDPAQLERVRRQLSTPHAGGAFELELGKALHPGRPARAAPDTPEAIASFHRARFADMGDFRFVISGDVSEAELAPLVERYLASLPGTERSRWTPPKNDRRPGVTRLRLAGRDARSSAVRLTFHGPAQPNAAARVDLEALVQQLQATLHDTLREQLGATYDVAVSNSWSAASYLLNIEFECEPERVAALQQASWDVIRQLRAGQISQGAIEALKARLRTRQERLEASSGHWADELESAYRQGLPLSELAKLPKLREGVTRESLAAAARQYLRSDRYLDAVWSPAE